MKKIHYIKNPGTIELARQIGGLSEALYIEIGTKLRKNEIRKAALSDNLAYFIQCNGIGEKRAKTFIERAKAYYAEHPTRIDVKPAHYFAKMVSLDDVRDRQETQLFWSIVKCKDLKDLKAMLNELAEYEEYNKKTPFKVHGEARRITLPESMDEHNLHIEHYADSDAVMVFNHQAHKFVELNTWVQYEMDDVLANPPAGKEQSETAWYRYMDFLEIQDLVSRACIAYVTRIVAAGYLYNNQLYSFDTASSGGIKKANCYMLRNDIRKQQSDARWCGTNPKEIISCGGGNMPATKPLQYQALRKSKAMPIERVIGKRITTDNCIIVHDKIMRKIAKVGKIDEQLDFNLAEQEIEIDPFDGVIVSMENIVGDIVLQLRAEYVKGLAVPFDLIGYCERRHIKPILKDIDGIEHDLSVENIVFILSQSSWKGKKSFRGAKDWQDKLRSVNRTDIFVCAFDDEEEQDKQLSNQSMQTLVNITNEELLHLAQPTIDELNTFKLPASARDIVGRTEKKYDEVSNMAKLVRTYPDVLTVSSMQKELKDRFISRRNKAMYGKLNVNGSFHFVAPDMIAWAQVYIEGRDVNDPTIGCLKAGECCCKTFENGVKLAQLRYPHLFYEWATSTNNTNNSYLKGNIIYKSIHDLDRLIHMSDYDGDHLLVIDDPELAEIAERTRKELDIPILYFEPLQAKASKYKPFTQEWIAECLYVGKMMDEIGARTNLIKSAWAKLDIAKSKEEIAQHLQIIAKLWYLANVSVDAQKTYNTVEVPAEFRHMFERLPSYQRYREASGFLTEDQHREADNKFATKSNGTIDRLGDLLDSRVNATFELDTSAFQYNYKMLIPMEAHTNVGVYDTKMTHNKLYEALLPASKLDNAKAGKAMAVIKAIDLGLPIGLIDFVSALNVINGAYWNELKASKEYKAQSVSDEVERAMEDKRIGDWRIEKERELIIEFVRSGWRQGLNNPKAKQKAEAYLALDDDDVLRIAARHVLDKNSGGRAANFRHIVDLFGDMYAEAVVCNEAALRKIVDCIEGGSEINNVEYFQLLERMQKIFGKDVTEDYLCKYAAHMKEMRTFKDGDAITVFEADDADDYNDIPLDIDSMIPPVEEESISADIMEELNRNLDERCF